MNGRFPQRSRDRRPSDDEVIEATAAAWLAQRDDGLSPAEAAAFAAWRAADIRHEATTVRLERTWATLQQLREFRPEARRHPDPDLLRATARQRPNARRPALRAAAALAASLVLVAAWWFASAHRSDGRPGSIYATAAGGFQRISLEDGSTVELNSNSEVRVDFTTAERRVCLVRGEAHFIVDRNKARPFSVEAGPVTVRALGTAFNVRLGDRDIEVLVTEGQVTVTQAERGSPELPSGADKVAETGATRRASPEPALLAANQRVIIPAVRVPAERTGPSPLVIEKVAPDVVRASLAWQGPRLVFADTPLADAIAQFNRRNQVQIVLADPELGSVPIGGSFRAENVDAFVRLLASPNDMAVERPEPDRIVLRKAR